MLAENQEDSAISQMDDLFGEPPLIKGEDTARYSRLLAAIAHEMKPETVFDKIHVREFTDKIVAAAALQTERSIACRGSLYRSVGEFASSIQSSDDIDG
jgi:hypothetical protein